MVKLLLGVLLVGCGGGLEPNDGVSDTPTDNPTGDGQTLPVDARGAAWVAFQEGEGAWQVLEGEERYALELHPNAKYGVAHLCADEAAAAKVTEVSVTLTYATLAARSEVATPCSVDAPDPDFYTLSGQVSGLSGDETAYVDSEFGTSRVTSEGAYSLAGFTAGTYDLLVTVRDTPDTSDTSNPLSPPSKILVQKDISIQKDQTLDVDLSSATMTVLREVALDGARSGEEVYASVSLFTRRGASAALGFFADTLEESAGDEAVSFDYAALPTLGAGTEYRLLVESVLEDEGDLSSRALERTFTVPDDNTTFRLPDPLGTAELSLRDSLPELTWDAYAENADHRIVLEDSSNETEGETRYVIFLDDTWLAKTTYTLPDFSTLSGWQDAWTLGGNLFWELNARVEKEAEVVSVSRSSRFDTTSTMP